MDMERQIAQFYLQMPAAFKGGDPIASALSKVASGVLTGVAAKDQMQTASLNRELSRAREERAKAEEKRTQEDHDAAKKEREQAEKERKREQMAPPPKAPETASGIAEYMNSQPEFADVSPEDIIHSAVALAKDGKTIADVQDQVEKQRTAAARAAASAEGAAASTTRAETGEKKREDVVEGVGSTKTESEASITNRGKALAQERIGNWEKEVGRPITKDEVVILRDALRAELQNVTDEVQRKMIAAQITLYDQMLLQTDLGRTSGPTSGINTRGVL